MRVAAGAVYTARNLEAPDTNLGIEMAVSGRGEEDIVAVNSVARQPSATHSLVSKIDFTLNGVVRDEARRISAASQSDRVYGLNKFYSHCSGGRFIE